ncbi:MAG TPA: restriction endonuclease subunit S [Candidatus Binatia bacterium]|jgi:type I restriction enzyme S subunit
MGLKPLRQSSVRAGYKETEVGVIPENWEVKTVGELAAAKVIDKPLDGNHGNIHPKSSDYVAYGIPFVMANNISGGRVDYNTCKFITKERADKLQKGFSVSGDVLLTHKGTVGNTAIVGPLTTDYIMLTPQVTYYRIRDPQQLNNSFLRHYFDSGPFHSLFLNLSGGGTRAYLGIVRQLALPVVLPPLPEQRAIAEALGDVDALLGALEKLIAKKRDLKQAAMQQLLTGQKRLPGFSGEWKVKTLGDCLLSRPDYGINAPAVPFSDRLPSYIRITDISEDGRFSPDPRVSVSAANADQFYLNQGDLVFARTGASVGKSYLYDTGDGQLVFAGFLIRVKPNPEVLVSAFLAAYVTTRSYWNWVRFMSMRSGQPGINGNEYAQLPIPLPSLPEQTAIAEVLSDMDAEIVALQQRLAKTRALKQGMMQELLTGKTRLVADGTPRDE